MLKRVLFLLLACFGVAVLATAQNAPPGARPAAPSKKPGAAGAPSPETGGSGGSPQDPGAVEAAETNPGEVKATGRLRLIGSGAFPELVLTGEGKQWYIAGEEMPKLNALQQQTVTLEGEETIRELKWANGRPAGKRRYLHNVRVVSVEVLSVE